MNRQTEAVHLLEADPDLGALLSEGRRAEAERELVVRTHRLPIGPWDVTRLAGASADHLGLLILDGVLARELLVADQISVELLGPGDVVRPGHDAMPDEIPFGTYWRAISDMRLAVLDARFMRAAAMVPEAIPALLASVSRRTGTVSRQLVIVQGQAVENRVLATLDELAQRWGVRTGEGTVLPGFISQGTLALLLGARRPSVTSAMVRLTARGLVARHPDGRWLLPAQHPSAAAA
jgi:CRP-like cAMP-binding protein